MINRLTTKNYIKELRDRHNNYTGKYQFIADKDFELYLKYMSKDTLHTYQGFKDFKNNK